MVQVRARTAEGEYKVVRMVHVPAAGSVIVLAGQRCVVVEVTYPIRSRLVL